MCHFVLFCFFCFFITLLAGFVTWCVGILIWTKMLNYIPAFQSFLSHIAVCISVVSSPVSCFTTSTYIRGGLPDFLLPCVGYFGKKNNLSKTCGATFLHLDPLRKWYPFPRPGLKRNEFFSVSMIFASESKSNWTGENKLPLTRQAQWDLLTRWRGVIWIWFIKRYNLTSSNFFFICLFLQILSMCSRRGLDGTGLDIVATKVGIIILSDFISISPSQIYTGDPRPSSYRPFQINIRTLQ